MNGRIPMLGQQPPQQIVAIQQVVGCYMSVLPIVTEAVLRDKDQSPAADIPDRIADQAWRITIAAMKKIGIGIPELPPEQ